MAAGVAGALVDRFENRRVLIVVSLGQAAVVSAMLAGIDNLWALLALMMLLGCGVAVSQPAEFALVPAAAGPDTEAARANGLMETTRSLGFTAGPVVGGALGAAGWLRLALALNALSFVLVAAAAAGIRARRHPAEGAQPPASDRAREGFAFLLRERDMAITLGGAVAALAVFSISATAEPFFVTDSLGAGSLAYGVLLTSWTLGMAAGSAGLAHRVGRARLAAGALAAVVLQGSGIAGASVAPVLWVALIGFVFGGLAHGVRRRDPDHFRIHAGAVPAGRVPVQGAPQRPLPVRPLGVVFKGSFRVTYLDGDEEIITTGHAYHLRPGHFVQTLEPVELLELSPVEEHDRTMATLARNMGQAVA